LRVTVYSKDQCPGCRGTYRALDKKGIAYDVLRVDEDPVAKAKAESYGYLQAPVVVVDLGDGAEWTWAGFQPTQIDKLHKLVKGADPEVSAA
jgi:glutaredoxin-like protein NrdH